LRGLALQTTAGELIATGQTVTLTYTPVGAFDLITTPGSLTLSGGSVDLDYVRALALDVTSNELTLSGGTVTLTYAAPGAYDLEVTAGTLTAAGQTVTMTYSAAVTLADVYAKVLEIHKILGLDADAPMTVTPTSRFAGDISQTISGDGTTSTTVTRDP